MFGVEADADGIGGEADANGIGGVSEALGDEDGMPGELEGFGDALFFEFV